MSKTKTEYLKYLDELVNGRGTTELSISALSQIKSQLVSRFGIGHGEAKTIMKRHMNKLVSEVESIPANTTPDADNEANIEPESVNEYTATEDKDPPF